MNGCFMTESQNDRIERCFDPAIQAIVLRREYDHVARVGRLWLWSIGCTDMTGAIAWASSIDPGVRRVETYNENGADTTYVRSGDRWKAVRAA